MASGRLHFILMIQRVISTRKISLDWNLRNTLIYFSISCMTVYYNTKDLLT